MEEKNLYYQSTRGDKKRVLSTEAIIKGIANDGGLFVPESIPQADKYIYKLKSIDYKELAFLIMKGFFTDYYQDELKDCINKAYDNKFDTEIIAPLSKKMGVYFLELYHGPTLAFKDMALSLLPHLLKKAAQKLNLSQEIVILTATSGDTGKAALQGFANVEGTKIIVFFPYKGVSKIQERQMLTQEGANTYVVDVKGNFDDAQRGVKEIFEDPVFNKKIKEKNYIFSSANSINIGRLIPQIVYYFYAYLNMLGEGEIKNSEKINVAVPTGNFGDILAAYYAKEMGLPVNKLICASNENKVLADFFNTGVYDKRRKLVMTISPSMDILVSSNLERLLWAISERDAKQVKRLLNSLREKGFYRIKPAMKKKLKDFYGGFAPQEESRQCIKEIFEKSKYLIDPHTAVAYAVYKKYIKETGDKTKTVIVATASPFKFTKSVMESIDSRYRKSDDFELIEKMSDLAQISIPPGIRDIRERPIRHKMVCGKEEMRVKIAEILD
ncbi:MAG TPA: threonine synthase [Candidatus Atribacteria bacterium]|jgi:threonine synthase|nr:threonine synthase [Candidatus Atribacteria bacterium]